MTATLTRPMPARTAPARINSARTTPARPTPARHVSAQQGHRVAGRQIPARPAPGVRPVSGDFGHYRYSGYSAEPAFDVVLPRSVSTIYLRRRVVAALAFSVTMLLLWLGAGNVLASRGGDPASVSTARPGATYVVQAGDTLWSIADTHRGDRGRTEYVEALIALHGSTVVHVGQVVALP